MNFLKSLDWKLNIAVLVLLAAGMTSLASTSPALFHKQIVWFVISLVVFILMFIFDWRPYVNYRGVVFGLYALGIVLLVATYFFAPSIRGVRGWIVLGTFQFQVSELIKLILIVFYANFFSRRHAGIARVSNLFLSFL